MDGGVEQAIGIAFIAIVLTVINPPDPWRGEIRPDCGDSVGPVACKIHEDNVRTIIPPLKYMKKAKSEKYCEAGKVTFLSHFHLIIIWRSPADLY